MRYLCLSVKPPLKPGICGKTVQCLGRVLLEGGLAPGHEMRTGGVFCHADPAIDRGNLAEKAGGFGRRSCIWRLPSLLFWPVAALALLRWHRIINWPFSCRCFERPCLLGSIQALASMPVCGGCLAVCGFCVPLFEFRGMCRNAAAAFPQHWKHHERFRAEALRGIVSWTRFLLP